MPIRLIAPDGRPVDELPETERTALAGRVAAGEWELLQALAREQLAKEVQAG